MRVKKNASIERIVLFVGTKLSALSAQRFNIDISSVFPNLHHWINVCFWEQECLAHEHWLESCEHKRKTSDEAACSSRILLLWRKTNKNWLTKMFLAVIIFQSWNHACFLDHHLMKILFAVQLIYETIYIIIVYLKILAFLTFRECLYVYMRIYMHLCTSCWWDYMTEYWTAM